MIFPTHSVVVGESQCDVTEGILVDGGFLVSYRCKLMSLITVFGSGMDPNRVFNFIDLSD